MPTEAMHLQLRMRCQCARVQCNCMQSKTRIDKFIDCRASTKIYKENAFPMHAPGGRRWLRPLLRRWLLLPAPPSPPPLPMPPLPLLPAPLMLPPLLLLLLVESKEANEVKSACRCDRIVPGRDGPAVE